MMEKSQKMVASLMLLVVCLCVAAGDAEFSVPRASFEAKVDTNTTVASLKQMVADKLGLTEQDLKLTLDGRELDESLKLAELTITDDSEIDYKLTESGKQNAVTTTPKTKNTYFGVDADDAEAVREKQRELSENKFRELFGDDAVLEIDNHLHDNEDKKHGEPKPVTCKVKEALKWMFDLAKRGLGRSGQDQQQHSNSGEANSTTTAP